MNLLTAEEYAIKRFETSNNDKVNFLKEWQEHSLKQGWIALTFVLNEYNWEGYKENSEKVLDEFRKYLFALGYKEVRVTRPDTIISPDGHFRNGSVVRAYPERQTEKKQS